MAKKKSKSKEPETKELEAKEPETKELEAKEPKTKELEAKEPKTKELEAKEPKTKELEAKEPKTKELEAKEPKTKESIEKSVEIKEKTIEKVTKEIIAATEDTDDSKKNARKKNEIKLFNRWSFRKVKVQDESLLKYINLRPIIIPHSGGKHEHKRFWKTERMSIVERFINKILAPGFIGKRIKGRNASLTSGKKQKVLKIIENAFSIISETSGNNPIQILVDAIINSSPREETTRISLGGISYQTAVDISPQRRIDLAIKILVQSSVGSTYNNLKTVDECIANELLLASQKNQNSNAIRRRDEIERIAISAR
ncbi:MAG: 30S ribosomal protein S7 [Promethearchaeota archaeon]